MGSSNRQQAPYAPTAGGMPPTQQGAILQPMQAPTQAPQPNARSAYEQSSPVAGGMPPVAGGIPPGGTPQFMGSMPRPQAPDSSAVMPPVAGGQGGLTPMPVAGGMPSMQASQAARCPTCGK